jgi:hypothetical protein
MSGVGVTGLTNRTKPEFATYTVQSNAKGYAVYDPEGLRISDWTDDKGHAVRLMKQKQHYANARARKTKRPCMCCSNVFDSEGIHNRMCLNCRGRSDADLAPAQLGRISGLSRGA